MHTISTDLIERLKTHLAGAIDEVCEQTGLSWDESIAMLGLAAKVIATEAKFNEPDYDCEGLGLRRLNEGYKQAIDLKFTTKNTGSIN
jgi:hypothetical protein